MRHRTKTYVFLFVVVSGHANASRIRQSATSLSRHVLDTSSKGPGKCHYTSLVDAVTKEMEDKSVEVKYCEGREVRLGDETHVDTDAFAKVQWLTPDLVGQDLESVDESSGRPSSYFIEEYTGSFKFARNVEAQVLRGLSPFLVSENKTGAWKSTTRGPLTQEVLQWTVGLGTALNKLPDQDEQMTVWRGQWEFAETVKRMHALPSGFRWPWFQSTTTNFDHCTEFFHPMYEPQKCKPCIETQQMYPVLYEFHTKRAKDVRKWNPNEDELILLPNMPFDITHVERVANDPMLEADSSVLVQWLREKHTCLDDTVVGPFFPIAEAVEAHGMKGQEFKKLVESGYATVNGNYIMKWMVSLGLTEDAIPYQMQIDLNQALKARYLLPAKKGNYDIWSPNTVPFYFKVIAEDSA